MKKYEFNRGTNRGAKGVTEIRMDLPQDVRKWIDRAKSENAHKPRAERPTKPHICEALVGEALEAIGLGAKPIFYHVAGIRKRNGKRKAGGDMQDFHCPALLGLTLSELKSRIDAGEFEVVGEPDAKGICRANVAASLIAFAISLRVD